jgi:glycosyltransferase involved in cell wall biosynthesis
MVEALNRAGHKAIAVSRTGGPIAEQFSSSIEQLHLPFASKWDYLSRWRLTRLINHHKPDIVQTYMGRATQLTRLPANSDAVHIARLGGYYKIPGYYDHAHAWIGNTKDICSYLVKQNLPAERIFHIGNFVPRPPVVPADVLAQVRSSLQLPDNAFVIFALGRMIEKKGFQDLIEAFAMLLRVHAGRPLVLIIAGDGAERGKYETLARQLNVSTSIRFVGWQVDPVPYFKQADIFVCPSRHEPLGNIILEAWTHALPVLSTLNDGARELIKTDINALTVPINSPSGMVEGLQRMLSLSLEERQSLVEEGFKTLEIHSENAVINTYINLYDRLCIEHRAHGTTAG